jgi:hypothetical protein
MTQDDTALYTGNTISHFILTPFQRFGIVYTPPTTEEYAVFFRGVNVSWQGDPNVTWQGV